MKKKKQSSPSSPSSRPSSPTSSPEKSITFEELLRKIEGEKKDSSEETPWTSEDEKYPEKQDIKPQHVLTQKDRPSKDILSRPEDYQQEKTTTPFEPYIGMYTETPLSKKEKKISSHATRSKKKKRTPRFVSSLLTELNDAKGFKRAFIMSEIFQRKY